MVSNKEKLNNFISELREIVEKANWAFMVTGVGDKPIVGQRGEVKETKAEVEVKITVGDAGKGITLKSKKS